MAKSNAKNEVYFSLLPSSKKDRSYGGFDLLAVQITWGIAAWFFLTGAQTGMYLNAGQALPTIIAGNMVPLIFIAFGGLIGARFGIEQFSATTNAFGQKLSGVILCVGIFTIMLPNASAALMSAQATTKFVALFNDSTPFSSGFFGIYFWGYVATIVGSYIAFRGPGTISIFAKVAAISMIVVLTGFIIYIFAYYGFNNLFSAEPQGTIEVGKDASLNMAWNRASSFEINFGLGISWGYVFGQWTRLAKTEGQGFHGCFWGWGLLSVVAGAFSAFTALAIGVYDPTLWVVKISEETSINLLAIIGLALMSFANMSSIATVNYTMALSARTRWPKFKWLPTLVIISAIPIPFIAPAVYEAISNIYGIIALATGVYSGVMVFDYLFVTKGRINLREVFNRHEGYHYWKGCNPAALMAIIVGFATYVLILNPLTWESYTGLFPYITAGLPAFLATGITYTVCMKVWVLKKYPVSFLNDIPFEQAK